MPKLGDIEKVLIIGSGGIVIGQAAEFDYSGSQALKALREEGIKSVLINPNVATIQTGTRLADKVYLEPITPRIVERIIERENVDGILLGFGGQTALNVGAELGRSGVLQEHAVRVLGTGIRAIEISEDRYLFKERMASLGLRVPESGTASTPEDCLKVANSIGYPIIIRTSYTLGGTGAGIAETDAELRKMVMRALKWTTKQEILVEKYIGPWKEVEYEVMRDSKGNSVAVATMEGVDPLGIHTGDKIVVSPIQTLTNEEYQDLRDDSLGIVGSIDIVGECNIQYGIDPDGKDQPYVIELNPRMSRSSALASKATGYPLAYIAAKLALGYGLDELLNKVTGVTIAGFEPAMDYMVVKIPRWDFEKFSGEVDRTIGPMMKSVGEVMAIGRSFEEAIQKAIRMMDKGKLGLLCNEEDSKETTDAVIREGLSIPNDRRILYIGAAFSRGYVLDEVHELTKIDRWFLSKIRDAVLVGHKLREVTTDDQKKKWVLLAKRYGYCDEQIAKLLRCSEEEVRDFRTRNGIKPSFKIIDTTAAEWPSRTNYCYVSYGDTEDDVEESSGKSKALVLGAGSNRIGSSVEFDYCTMNLVWSLKSEGIDEVIVANNNPETVSTDYDMSDKLYFEELSLERVLDIVEKEKPMGVVVSVGGQIPNNLALSLSRLKVKILGTSAESIDAAEDRSKFSSLLDRLGIPQPPWSRVHSLEQAKSKAMEFGYPVLIRPSYVLSGAAMSVANNENELVSFVERATRLSGENPVVITKFIDGAIECEIDAVSDRSGNLSYVILEHIEAAGTHSGDAIVVTPPQRIGQSLQGRMVEIARACAKELSIRGPFNIQFLLKKETVYVIEVNLRASRSMPFSSKATGLPLAYLAAKAILGREINNHSASSDDGFVSVKVPTFSFARLKGADPVLGVEMNSTGEVACTDKKLSRALLKALLASGMKLPGRDKAILLTVSDREKPRLGPIAAAFSSNGYRLFATEGTSRAIRSKGYDVERVSKIGERPQLNDILSLISEGKMGLIVNIPAGSSRIALDHMYSMRRTAVEFSIPIVTEMNSANAIAEAMKEGLDESSFDLFSLTERLRNVSSSALI